MRILPRIFIAVILPLAAVSSVCSAPAAFSEETSKLHAVIEGRTSDSAKSDAFFRLGEIYYESMKTQEALNYYLSAYHYARSRKRKIRALIRLSEIYYSEHSLGKAIEFAKDAVVLSGRAADIRKKLARYYMEADLYAPAAEEYKKAIAVDRKDADALIGAASALEAQGLYSDAIEYYKRALMLKTSAEITRKIVHCYENLSQTDIAEVMLKESLSARPDYQGYMQLGGLYYFVSNYEGAVKAFSSAIGLNPSREDAFMQAGISYYKSGRLREAEEMFKIIISRNSGGVAVAHFFMGLIADASSETGRASAEYSAAGSSSKSALLSDIAAALKSSPPASR